MDVGARVKQRREFLNLSQDELARLSGVSQSSIHYIESGKNSPTAKTLAKLAAALGVSMAELLRDHPAAGEQPGVCGNSQGGQA